MKITAIVKRKDNHNYIEFTNARVYRHVVDKFKDGSKVVIEIKEVKPKRSLEQNAYWWGACYPVLADLTGHTINEVHEICKAMFLKPEIITVSDKISGVKEIRKSRSTTKLSKSEGVEYTDHLRQLAVDLGGYIPTPCEAGYFCGRDNCQTCKI